MTYNEHKSNISDRPSNYEGSQFATTTGKEGENSLNF